MTFTDLDRRKFYLYFEGLVFMLGIWGHTVLVVLNSPLVGVLSKLKIMHGHLGKIKLLMN